MRRKTFKDFGVEPLLDRLDATKDLPIRWKWKGFGQTPEPEVTFSAVVVDGQRIGVSLSEKGWAGSRACYACPVCQKRSRFLYRLKDGRFGCNQHVSKTRVKLEAALAKLKKAKRMQRNHKYRAAGKRLEAEVNYDLDALLGFDDLLDWVRRETKQAKGAPGDAEAEG